MPLISDMLPGFLGKSFWVSPQDAESLLIWILKMLNEKGPFPPSNTPKENPRIFLWNAGRLQGVFNHPEYTTDGKWHWLRMADVSSNFCTNKLVKPLCLFSDSLMPYTSDRTSLLIPVSHFPTIGFLFFPYSFLLLELSPCSCLPSSTLKLCSLKALSFTSGPYSIDHSVPCLGCISLCLYCILWGSDQEFSSPESRWHWSTSL